MRSLTCLWKGMPSLPDRHGEKVDSVANTAGTSYGEFISVIKSEFSCKLAGYRFARSSFEDDDLRAVGSVPARSSVTLILPRSLDIVNNLLEHWLCS